MAAETVAYVAVSLDGYIAEADGSVTFLDDFGSEEYDFHGFLESIGALVMGSTTYEQVLGFGWPYGDRPCLVLTSRELDVPDGANVTFTGERTGRAIRAFAESAPKRVWVVGGGRVIVDGMREGGVDLLDLFVMPVVLGTGIPLFPERFDGALELVESDRFTNGVVRLVYRATAMGDEPVDTV
jgi:dihydrofolate reductase